MGLQHTDSTSYRTVALPAAAASAATGYLDLGPGGGRNMEQGILSIALPATPSLANTKSITVTVQECATSGGSYTTVPGYGNLSVTGAGGVGAAAKTWSLRVHDHVLQFVKVSFAVEASGGDNTAVSATVALEM